MDGDTKAQLKSWLRAILRKKLDGYTQETSYMPFFDAIFSKEQVRTASIIQSFYTTFGMSVYEQMSKIMAEGAGFHAENQYRLLGSIDKTTENLITKLHMELLKGKKADRGMEVEAILRSIKEGKAEKDPESVVDVFIEKPNGEEYYFDITTVKPNLKQSFINIYGTLLEELGGVTDS